MIEKVKKKENKKKKMEKKSKRELKRKMNEIEGKTYTGVSEGTAFKGRAKKGTT